MLLAMLRWMAPFLLLSALARPGLAEPPRLPIAAVQGSQLAIEGRVIAVDGNRFVLADDSGEILVETWPEGAGALRLAPGEHLRVEGRPWAGRFIAWRLLPEGREAIEVRPERGPPPWARRGARFGGPRGGIPVSDETSRLAREAGAVAPEDLPEILQAAGYRELGAVSLHPRHYELRAINPWGEPVRVHVDFAGRIYKERRTDPASP